LDGVLRCYIGLVSIQELLEFLALIWRDDYVTCGEAVGASVLRRSRSRIFASYGG
jgi:hypothetical protein